ncbi:MAG: ATP-binding protein [Minwuia sp.]|uniref:ATP-binding protein n=1 Tax=Minwuia sp. TaxID=2493630 RepID=UPI003A84AF55
MPPGTDDMAIAEQKDDLHSPRATVLADCLSSLAVIRKASLAGEGADAGVRMRWLKRLHTLKGATGFIGAARLTRVLHRLESFLAGPGKFDADAFAVTMDEIMLILDGMNLEAEDLGEPAVYRFGSCLWWANELVQKTADREGKRLFMLVQGGDLFVPSRAYEALKVALPHLAVNAVVHGIEAPDVRKAAGKPETGLITISAEACSDGLQVRFADNGGGIPDEIVARVFQDGFTTQNVPTELAGRGVGLSEARDAVEAAGGRIVLETSAGLGASFTLDFRK